MFYTRKTGDVKKSYKGLRKNLNSLITSGLQPTLTGPLAVLIIRWVFEYLYYQTNP